MRPLQLLKSGVLLACSCIAVLTGVRESQAQVLNDPKGTDFWRDQIKQTQKQQEAAPTNPELQPSSTNFGVRVMPLLPTPTPAPTPQTPPGWSFGQNPFGAPSEYNPNPVFPQVHEQQRAQKPVYLPSQVVPQQPITTQQINPYCNLSDGGVQSREEFAACAATGQKLPQQVLNQAASLYGAEGGVLQVDALPAGITGYVGFFKQVKVVEYQGYSASFKTFVPQPIAGVFFHCLELGKAASVDIDYSKIPPFYNLRSCTTPIPEIENLNTRNKAIEERIEEKLIIVYRQERAVDAVQNASQTSRRIEINTLFSGELNQIIIDDFLKGVLGIDGRNDSSLPPEMRPENPLFEETENLISQLGDNYLPKGDQNTVIIAYERVPHRFDPSIDPLQVYRIPTPHIGG